METEGELGFVVSSCVLVCTTDPSVSPLEPDTPQRTHHFHWYASSLVLKHPHLAGALGTHPFVALNRPVYLMLKVALTHQVVTPVPAPLSIRLDQSRGQTGLVFCPVPQNLCASVCPEARWNNLFLLPPQGSPRD